MAEAAEKTDSDSLLKDAREMFGRCKVAEDHNRITFKDDTRFARLGEQWPADIQEQREREGRPCLTINRLPSFIRQVVNDARQNKPSIKVRPADSGADPETAEVINGLIRNIEYTSNADVAYDTGVDSAVTGGFGYWRVDLDYAYEDSFDLDIKIDRISNPLSVYGDPNSTSADSSDWNDAFITEVLTNSQFKAKYPNAGEHADWDDEDAWKEAPDWHDNGILVAEWWHREQVEKVIFQTEDGQIISQEQIDSDEDVQGALENKLTKIKTDETGNPVQRTVKAYKVTQRIMTGLEILEENEWPGCYIPIVPVYGDEIVMDGKRYFRSMVHDAIDAQRMSNYWRTTSTELVALAPRVPYIGEEGAFDVDIDVWSSINTRSHAFAQYSKGTQMPQRQPLDAGPAAGALNEAMLASDDMKNIMGLHDASLGARSNETSGRAIMARQREGDTSTFHFLDNLNRAIRHTGRIIIDLIPSVYNTARIVRVIGEDGSEESKPVNQPYPATDPKTGEPITQPVMGQNGQPMLDERGQELQQAVMAIHNLTAGKYDLTVTTGPSFTTRREEAAYQMTEMMRALPQSAMILGKHLAKNLDWPGADDIAEELEALSPKPQQGLPPEIQQLIKEGQARIQELEKENEQLKGDKSLEAAKVQETQRSNMADEAIDEFDSITKRMGVANRPVQQPNSGQAPR